MSILENIKHLVSESIKSDSPHFIFITGSAGTGKTTLVKYGQRFLDILNKYRTK